LAVTLSPVKTIGFASGDHCGARSSAAGFPATSLGDLADVRSVGVHGEDALGAVELVMAIEGAGDVIDGDERAARGAGRVLVVVDVGEVLGRAESAGTDAIGGDGTDVAPADRVGGEDDDESSAGARSVLTSLHLRGAAVARPLSPWIHGAAAAAGVRIVPARLFGT
jgi:hypothetical protein